MVLLCLASPGAGSAMHYIKGGMIRLHSFLVQISKILEGSMYLLGYVDYISWVNGYW